MGMIEDARLEQAERLNKKMNRALSESSGVKHDQDKIRMDLLPMLAVEELAKVLSYGAKKYSPDNWRKGMVWSRLFGATLRHLFAWWRGKDLDEESGLPHIAHALCCVAFLAEYHTTRKEFDDRSYKDEK